MTLPANPSGLESLALTHALLGEANTALDHLRQALDLGWANYYGVISDPAWSQTLKIPEFEALLDGAKVNNDRQRAIVEAADAEQDFRAEFAGLLSVHAETQ